MEWQIQAIKIEMRGLMEVLLIKVVVEVFVKGMMA
jgi:hypothetical protein